MGNKSQRRKGYQQPKWQCRSVLTFPLQQGFTSATKHVHVCRSHVNDWLDNETWLFHFKPKRLSQTRRSTKFVTYVPSFIWSEMLNFKHTKCRLLERVCVLWYISCLRLKKKQKKHLNKSWTLMFIFNLLSGQEWRAQAGAILQGNLCILRPVAAHLEPLLVQRTDQMSAHLLPVGVFTGTWLQLPRCSLQCPQDLGRPHLLCAGWRLSHLAGTGLLCPRWGKLSHTFQQLCYSYTILYFW